MYVQSQLIRTLFENVRCWPHKSRSQRRGSAQIFALSEQWWRLTVVGTVMRFEWSGLHTACLDPSCERLRLDKRHVSHHPRWLGTADGSAVKGTRGYLGDRQGRGRYRGPSDGVAIRVFLVFK